MQNQLLLQIESTQCVTNGLAKSLNLPPIPTKQPCNGRGPTSAGYPWHSWHATVHAAAAGTDLGRLFGRASALVARGGGSGRGGRRGGGRARGGIAGSGMGQPTAAVAVAKAICYRL